MQSVCNTTEESLPAQEILEKISDAALTRLLNKSLTRALKVSMYMGETVCTQHDYGADPLCWILYFRTHQVGGEYKIQLEAVQHVLTSGDIEPTDLPGFIPQQETMSFFVPEYLSSDPKSLRVALPSAPPPQLFNFTFNPQGSLRLYASCLSMRVADESASAKTHTNQVDLLAHSEPDSAIRAINKWRTHTRINSQHCIRSSSPSPREKESSFFAALRLVPTETSAFESPKPVPSASPVLKKKESSNLLKLNRNRKKTSKDIPNTAETSSLNESPLPSSPKVVTSARHNHARWASTHIDVQADSTVFYSPMGVCLVSTMPTVENLRRPLRELYNRSAGEPLTPALIPTLKDVFDSLREFHRTCPNLQTGPQLFPATDIDVSIILRCLNPTNIAKVFVCALLEQKVLLTSSRTSALTSTCEFIRCLLAPLQWVQVYAPLLPRCSYQTLQCLTPFIMGVPKAYLAEVPPDVNVVDLDNDSVTLTEDMQRAVPAARRLSRALENVCRAEFFYCDDVNSFPIYTDTRRTHRQLELFRVCKIFLAHLLAGTAECSHVCAFKGKAAVLLDEKMFKVLLSKTSDEESLLVYEETFIDYFLHSQALDVYLSQTLLPPTFSK